MSCLTPLAAAACCCYFSGNREVDEQNKFSLPPHLSLKNLELITRAAASTEAVEAEGSKFGRHAWGRALRSAACCAVLAAARSASSLLSALCIPRPHPLLLLLLMPPTPTPFCCCWCCCLQAL